MKIIGHTTYGYLCEVSKDDMYALTGQGEVHGTHYHRISTIIKIPEFSKHLHNLDCTKDQRAKAAELLRSAANVIELTPSSFEAPTPVAAPTLQNPDQATS